MSLSEEFTELVARDVRHQLSSSKAAELRSKANLDRWHDALVVLAGKVDAQFSFARANLITVRNTVESMGFPVTVHEGDAENALHFGTAADYRKWISDQARWRANAVRFKMAIEERLLESRALRREIGDTKELLSAIIAHREHECTEACEPDCIADHQLWDILGAAGAVSADGKS